MEPFVNIVFLYIGLYNLFLDLYVPAWQGVVRRRSKKSIG
jgi:membrane-bound ClpP family serine protease